MAKNIQAIRGMNDCLPTQSPLWQKVESAVKSVVSAYGYNEVRMPIVEETNLFSRAVGEETDVVSKEMYTFDDRNGDSLTLRPEGTAGCVRSCIQNSLINKSRPSGLRKTKYLSNSLGLRTTWPTIGLTPRCAFVVALLISLRIDESYGLTTSCLASTDLMFATSIIFEFVPK